jgi:ketosteroid isomerase-like protein
MTRPSTNQSLAASDNDAGWKDEIIACEEQAVAAFLAADVAAMDQLLADDYVVNSPLQQILGKPQLLAMLGSGRIGHSSYVFDIEHISRRGDVAIVMGRDHVTNTPDGMLLHRRYTDVWQLENGSWRGIARHAHVVSREPARSASPA